eukprot:5977909-Prorocentrum_lima.AAC.1
MTGDPGAATLGGPYPAAGSGFPPAETPDWLPKVGPGHHGGVGGVSTGTGGAASERARGGRVGLGHGVEEWKEGQSREGEQRGKVGGGHRWGHYATLPRRAR